MRSFNLTWVRCNPLSLLAYFGKLVYWGSNNKPLQQPWYSPWSYLPNDDVNVQVDVNFLINHSLLWRLIIIFLPIQSGLCCLLAAAHAVISLDCPICFWYGPMKWTLCVWWRKLNEMSLRQAIKFYKQSVLCNWTSWWLINPFKNYLSIHVIFEILGRFLLLKMDWFRVPIQYCLAKSIDLAYVSFQYADNGWTW